MEHHILFYLTKVSYYDIKYTIFSSDYPPIYQYKRPRITNGKGNKRNITAGSLSRDFYSARQAVNKSEKFLAYCCHTL